MWQAWMWMTIVGSIVLSNPIAAVGAPPDIKSARWVAFVVPGTYGNSGSWFTLPTGQATFSSELQRSLGPRAEVYPFLWRSSIQHAVREKAAENLAVEIKEKAAPGDKVMLVGHSHGGNIALRAAALCGRKIDLVVCLATPHVYYRLAEGATKYSLPVYCSPEARAAVKEIVTLTARTDRVPDHYADLRKGIDENDALHSARGWRSELRGAAIPADGSWKTELVESALNAKFFSNLYVSASLNLASENIVYPCLVPCDRGEGAHQTVHSRRIGSLLGKLAVAPDSAKRRQVIHYLSSLTQSPGEDAGEPIPEEQQRQRDKDRAAKFELCGWYLLEAEITSKSNHDRLTHLFRSNPDPYFKLHSNEGDLLYLSAHRQDSPIATWSLPGVMVPAEGKITMRVCERNPLVDDELEAENLTIGKAGPPEVIVSGSWSAKLKWLAVHE